MPNYSVWLFTRPLSAVALFPPLAKSSTDPHLRHWGVLVTEMTINDANAIMLRTIPYGGKDNTKLGTMYELFRDNDDRNNVKISRSFDLIMLREQWRTFSAQYVDTTKMGHHAIKQSALRIITERPDYHLFENNCQNFAKYLLETICPKVAIPDTIEDVLKRLQNLRPKDSDQLPGAYPCSTSTTSSACVSLITTSGTTWVTALEYFLTTNDSVRDGDSTLSFSNVSQDVSPDRGTHYRGRRGGPLPLPLLFLSIAGTSALRRAILTRDLAEIELLRANVDPSGAGESEDTMLRIATRYHNGWTFRLKTATAIRRCTLWPRGKDSLEALKVLLDTNINVSAGSCFGRTALHFAVLDHRGVPKIKTVHMLLDANADTSAQDVDGTTPLHDASIRSCEEVVEMLLKAGADVSAQILSARPKKGTTALHLVASKSWNKGVAKLLLEANASVSARDCEGKTPLHWAVEHGNERIVRVLLDANAGASSIQDESGRTPLHQAAEIGDTEMMTMLLRTCTDINLKDNSGKTPLHIAVRFGKRAAVNILLVAKANVSLQDNNGWTPLQTAIQNLERGKLVDVGVVDILLEPWKCGVGAGTAMLKWRINIDDESFQAEE